MRPVVTDVPLSVFLSVGRNREPCRKTAEPIVLPFGAWTRVGPRNRVACIKWGGGGDPPVRTFCGDLPAHCEVRE